MPNKGELLDDAIPHIVQLIDTDYIPYATGWSRRTKVLAGFVAVVALLVPITLVVVSIGDATEPLEAIGKPDSIDVDGSHLLKVDEPSVNDTIKAGAERLLETLPDEVDSPPVGHLRGVTQADTTAGAVKATVANKPKVRRKRVESEPAAAAIAPETLRDFAQRTQVSECSDSAAILGLCQESPRAATHAPQPEIKTGD
jgi:hypothetical protein